MTTIDYEGMCELFQDGKMIWVENELNKMRGRMVGCHSNTIEVEIGGECVTWAPGDCCEMTFGYRVNYDVVRMYPHEFDTHVD